MVSDAKTVFLVIREPGMAWQRNREFKQQPDWAAHTAFMDSLFATGRVLFGGPLTQVPGKVVLVITAPNRESVYECLKNDPWVRHDRLRIASVHEWEWYLAAA